MPTFRSKRKGKKSFFVMSLRLSDHKVVTQHRIFIKFFQFRSDFLAFFACISYFKFLDLRNLIKQLFYSRLLDMRLVIANLALGALLAIYHLISNARSWNNYYYLLKECVDFQE